MSRSGIFRILVALSLLAIVLLHAEADRRPPPGRDRHGARRGHRAQRDAGSPAPPGTEAALEQARQVVRRSEVLGDKDVQLVCAISPALKDGHGYLAIGGHSDMIGRNVEVFDGKIYIPYVFPKAAARRQTRGRVPARGMARDRWVRSDEDRVERVASLDAAVGAGSGSGGRKRTRRRLTA
jgi:hypothetical protein